MQIRVTVLAPPPGRAAGGGTDVLITAPPDTPLADVLRPLANAAAFTSGGAGPVYCEQQRLDPRRARLGHAPLVDGAVLAFSRPAAAPAPDPVGGTLLVVAGPDAGGVHLLRGGGTEVRIGRSADADVPLDDPDVSRVHCALSLAADGSVTVTDLGSTNGTLVDGLPVQGGPVPVPPGAVLRVGESALRVLTTTPERTGSTSAPEPPGPAATAPPPGESRPDGTKRPVRGLVGWARRRAAETTHTGGFLSAAVGREAVPAAPPAPSRPTAEDDGRWPDPATLLLTALDAAAAPEGAPGLWSRRASGPQALPLRLGTVHRPDGRLAPVTVSLADTGSLGLAGPRRQLLGLARCALAQLAALHAPSALELVLLAPGKAADWAWAGWLPHLRPTRGQDCRLLTGFDAAQATARLAELTERLTPGAPRPAAGRRTVVLVDGDAVALESRHSLARLAAEGPAHGIHLLCLADTPPATPASPLAETLERARRSFPAFAACGTAALLSGAVASAVRLTGPAGVGPLATVDAVSAAWAERLARALAPLREQREPAAGTEGAQASPGAGPLPASCRLLDVLELPRVTPGTLRDRWNAGTGLPVVFGAGAQGPVGADLAQAPGPVVIEGGPSSGRTELLRSLAASLAAARGPRDLSVLLIEGEGDGLLPCAELPHVATHLPATDPVRMRAVAQALRGELKRRAALIGEDSFASARRRPLGRVAAPRQPDDDLPEVLAPGSGPLPWLVVLVDDLDALLAPPLGAPGRQAAGSVVRALHAAAGDGHRLGVRVIAAGGALEGPGIRVAMAGDPVGRAGLVRAGGRLTPFQSARVTGRIPRTATLRPTVVPLDWARAGDPPARRPVRELGNGPTDIALLASAASRAAQTGRTTAASLV
ncbi:FHA domain-containing protein [Streptomyces sp. 7-21]|uniref:FHA domain-containing protein n=1 Tax=Streptomyces sp. 7-21 TaxID=2802283 RepID=UPI00191D4543|nr:FHA domain-containing protein [Streptomyces sp. 7-21]MBL1068510.1 FHA domain-containing protein [Streptomyces sp. 7-21]